MVDASGDCRRLGGEGGIELLRAGAVPRHPDVEALLNFEVLDVSEVWREFLTIVDKSWNDDTVRPVNRSQFRFPLTSKHVTEFLRAPHAREVVGRPKRDQHTRRTQGRAERGRPRCPAFDLAVDVDLGFASELKLDVQLQQGHEVLRNPDVRLWIATVADEDVVLVAHDAGRLPFRGRALAAE